MEIMQVINIVFLLINSIVILYTVYELTKIKQQIINLKQNLIETKSQLELLEEATKKAINLVLSLQKPKPSNSNRVLTDEDIEKLKRAV